MDHCEDRMLDCMPDERRVAFAFGYLLEVEVVIQGAYVSDSDINPNILL